MAWLLKRGKQFHVGFRFGGQGFKKSLRTANETEANSALTRLEENLRDVARGRLVIPDDADVATFLLSDGRISTPIRIQKRLDLVTVFKEFNEHIPAGGMEANSLATVKIHLNHFLATIGQRFMLRLLTTDDLQRYVNTRTQQKNRSGNPISPVTIRKEITTLSTVWTFARDRGYVDAPFPNQGLRYPKGKEKPRFQTWKEVERTIHRDQLAEAEQSQLWDCLFLTLPEVDELCQFVSKNARHEFLYPMVLAAAHTGARRSELIRSCVSDFDLESNTVILREKKRSRRLETTRTVPLSPMLRDVVVKWFSNHPGGRFAFCLPSNACGDDGDEPPRQLTVNQAHDHFQRTLTGKWTRIRGWHVLRHSFASNCAAKGVDQRLINAWMGHQTEAMVRRYRHLIPDQQQSAIESVFNT